MSMIHCPVAMILLFLVLLQGIAALRHNQNLQVPTIRTNSLLIDHGPHHISRLRHNHGLCCTSPQSWRISDRSGKSNCMHGSFQSNSDINADGNVDKSRLMKGKSVLRKPLKQQV